MALGRPGTSRLLGEARKGPRRGSSPSTCCVAGSEQPRQVSGALPEAPAKSWSDLGLQPPVSPHFRLATGGSFAGIQSGPTLLCVWGRWAKYLEEGPGQGIERLVVQEADEQPQDGAGCRAVLQVQGELEGGAQALDLWTGCSGWGKPLGPGAPALPACFLLESPSSSCSNAIVPLPLRSQRCPEGWLQWVQGSAKVRSGRGLSEAELASGHRPQLPLYPDQGPALPQGLAQLTFPLLLQGPK